MRGFHLHTNYRKSKGKQGSKKKRESQIIDLDLDFGFEADPIPEFEKQILRSVQEKSGDASWGESALREKIGKRIGLDVKIEKPKR